MRPTPRLIVVEVVKPQLVEAFLFVLVLQGCIKSFITTQLLSFLFPINKAFFLFKCTLNKSAKTFLQHFFIVHSSIIRKDQQIAVRGGKNVEAEEFL